MILRVVHIIKGGKAQSLPWLTVSRGSFEVFQAISQVLKNPELNELGLWVIQGAAWRACEYNAVTTMIEKCAGPLRAQWKDTREPL